MQKSTVKTLLNRTWI